MLKFSLRIFRDWFSSAYGKVLLIGLASRLLVFASALFGSTIIGVRAANLSEGQWNVDLPVVNLFSRWDGGIYANIALNGYPSGGTPVGSLWNMFPLYPFLMRALGTLFFGVMSPFQSVLLAGFLINNILFFASLLIFYKLSIIVLESQRLAIISTIFFSFWAGSLFYSSVYTESLFMTFTLGAFYFMEKGKSAKSTFFGVLAGLTKSNGFLIFIPFLYNGFQKRNYRVIFQLVPLFIPYLLFSVYGYFLTSAFPVREIAYQYYYGSPVFILSQIANMELGYALLFSVGLLLVLIPFVWFMFSEKKPIIGYFRGLNSEHRDLKYWAFSLVILLMILFYSIASNVYRYAIPILPLYWVGAKIWVKNPKIGKMLLVLMTTILIIGTVLFTTWRLYW